MGLAICKTARGLRAPSEGDERIVLLTDITSGGRLPMLEKTLAFTEARNRMIATNIANIMTPGYREKQVDVSAFQKALRKAQEAREANDGRFELPRSKEFKTDEAGHLQLTPSEEPTQNLLFQDGTNARIERQMSQLAENTMMNRMASDLMQDYFDRISTAIRGRLR